MALLSERAPSGEKRQDKNGMLRLVILTPSMSEVLEETIGHIAIYAAGDRFVMAGLRRVLDIVERSARGEDAVATTLARVRKDLDSREQAKSAR